jgi:hypothetical protein
MADRSDEARLRAEGSFKKKERATQEGEKGRAERAAAQKAADDERARLKSLRLARDAAETPSPGATKGKNRKRPVGQTSEAPTMDALVHGETERGVLPTHRPVPVKRPSKPRKRGR